MRTLSNRIDRAFDALRRQKRKALIAYLTGGFPTLAATDRAARNLAAAGVDLLEIGVPFSDPIADGPTLQYSAHKALENGTTLARLLEWAGRFRRRSSIRLVFMTYMNPVPRFGVARFAAQKLPQIRVVTFFKFGQRTRKNGTPFAKHKHMVCNGAQAVQIVTYNNHRHVGVLPAHGEQ